MSDFSDSADFEWNLADEADTEDFEIDADATGFYMPQDSIVTFKAKALNGTPPFTFTWNFGDGSPPGTGEMIKHRYTKPGEVDATATGKDATGAEAIVTLGLLVATPSDWVARMRIDPKDLSPERREHC